MGERQSFTIDKGLDLPITGDCINHGSAAQQGSGTGPGPGSGSGDLPGWSLSFTTVPDTTLLADAPERMIL